MIGKLAVVCIAGNVNDNWQAMLCIWEYISDHRTVIAGTSSADADSVIISASCCDSLS